MMLTQRLLASDFRREIARVIPRSRAAFSLCKTQAYLGALPSRQPPSPTLPLFSCRSAARVDQMASPGRPPRTYVPDDDNADAVFSFPVFAQVQRWFSRHLCPGSRPVAKKCFMTLWLFTFLKSSFQCFVHFSIKLYILYLLLFCGRFFKIYLSYQFFSTFLLFPLSCNIGVVSSVSQLCLWVIKFY